jgi:hypothetical protein
LLSFSLNICSSLYVAFQDKDIGSRTQGALHILFQLFFAIFYSAGKSALGSPLLK